MSAISQMLNCTPHSVVVYDDKGENIVTVFPCSGYVARLRSKTQDVIGSIKLDSGCIISIYTPQVFQEKVEGLPPVDGGCYPSIIVSLVVGEHLRKFDAWGGAVYGPDMGEGAVRDVSGRLFGTTRLLQYPPKLTEN